MILPKGCILWFFQNLSFLHLCRMVNKDVRRMRAATLPDGTSDEHPAAQAGATADLDRPVDVLVYEVKYDLRNRDNSPVKNAQ